MPAAAASAIALVTTKLMPGQSTDGAVFYPSQGKPLGAGKLIVNAAGETFTVTLVPVANHGGTYEGGDLLYFTRLSVVAYS